MKNNNQLDEIVDVRQFFFKIINSWRFFVLSLLLTFSIAFLYNRYTNELFLVETSILVKENNSLGSASDLMFEKAMGSSNISIENKVLILKSYPLVYSTLADLGFDISYFISGTIKMSETFIAPIKVECNDVTKVFGKSIIIEYIDAKNFTLIYDDNQNNYQFGEEINFEKTNIRVNLDTRYIVSNSDIPTTVVKFKDLKKLTLFYQKKILITQKDVKSTVIDISILEEDQLKGVKFLNKLTENYIKGELTEKNIASKNTVLFINGQLEEMIDSLSLIEMKIQEYKNNNKITDLSLKAQSIYTNIINVDTELAKSKSLNNYYIYLENYINDGDNLESISISNSLGVSDIGLNMIINQLVELQVKKNILVDGGQINNPSVSQYNRQIKH